MGSEKWVETTLGEASSLVSYGYTESAAREKVGPHFLRITDIQNGVVDWDSVPFCPITEGDFSKYKLERGDIVVARTGNSTGENYIFNSDRDAVFASYLIRFRISSQVADPRFVWYCMRTPEWWAFVNASKTGSAQAGANAQVLGKFPLRLPSLPTQKRIAEILGALDDKIELNRRMNATLEAMARGVFKEWFVDSVSEGMPEGWEETTVGEVVDCVGGATPSTADPKFWESGTHHWTTPKDFSSLQSPILLDTERRITDAGVAKISSGLLPVGTVLMSSRAPVGYLAIAEIPVAINQGFIAMKCGRRASNYFMLHWCQDRMDEIKGRATGTTFAEISKQNFRPIPLVLPPQKMMDAFTEKVALLYAQVSANLQQAHTLGTIRDTLLSKLLSGELDVEALSGN